MKILMHATVFEACSGCAAVMRKLIAICWWLEMVTRAESGENNYVNGDQANCGPLAPVTLQNYILFCLCLACFYIKASKKVHPKVRNHGEGPYQGLLLVESAY